MFNLIVEICIFVFLINFVKINYFGDFFVVLNDGLEFLVIIILSFLFRDEFIVVSNILYVIYLWELFF